MSDNAIGVIGIDGYTPIYQPDARWTIWSIHDIYMGNEGKNRFIPKVGDYVVEPETGIIYIVTDLNNVTYIPELTPISLRSETQLDEITSSTKDNYRIYYDKSITPYTLSVDALLRIYSNTATYARIYKGHFIDDNNIISRRYDNNGNFLGHDIPLQLVAMNSHDNYAIKSIPPCNTNAELQDGETCTVVVFDSNSKVITKVTCIVEETTYVAQAYAEQKYIINIYLKTPFINPTNDTEVNYPVNLPIDSFNPIGVVQYNDGTSVEYPIDNDKFRLYGLDQFVSTIIGHRVPLVLSYRLDSNEATIDAVTSDNYFVTKPYTLVVSNPNTSYNVKLFIYPVWVDEIVGYKLRAYLMNLDRNVLFDVTDKISVALNSPTFNGKMYGITQRITFNVLLSQVSPLYQDFAHTQVFDFMLRAPATNTSAETLWEVKNNVPSSGPFYGANIRAEVDALTRKRLRFDYGITSVEDFIAKTYLRTNPLYNPLFELEPLTPTHIEVKYQSDTFLVDINQFNQEFILSNPANQYDNITITFLKQTLNDYLYLSVCEVPIRS